MSAYRFDPPVAFADERGQLASQLYTYLYQMAEQLNLALGAIDDRVLAITTGAAGAGAQGVQASGGAKGDLPVDAYNNLRALIIKNAHTVNVQMDALVEVMRGTYVAQSDFGDFMSELTNTITTTAEGVVMGFEYGSQLEAVNEELAGFLTYQTETEQYIKIGVVKYNDDGTPEAGVVVGKNLEVITVDGKELVRSVDMYSCFTANRLSFWQNGVEQAYFSNETLYVSNISVSDSITLGGSWKIDRTNGFSIKWVG